MLGSILKIGLILACFKISGKVPEDKDKFIRLDIGLDKHFLKSSRILVGALSGHLFCLFLVYLGCLQRLPLLWVVRKNSFSFNFLSMNGKIWVFWEFHEQDFFMLIIDRMPSQTFLESFLLSSKNDL